MTATAMRQFVGLKREIEYPGALRWIVRDGVRHLQQFFKIETLIGRDLADIREEWRDVPIEAV